MALPREVATIADAHYREQAKITREATDRAQRVWRARDRGNLWPWWDSEGAPELLDIVTEAQIAAAGGAQPYLEAMGRVQGFQVPERVNALGFASPTDELAEWLRLAPATATDALLAGAPRLAADRAGLAVLLRMVGTLAADAGREATGVGIAVTPSLTGYYRKLRTPSCSRCAILAGRMYKTKEPFLRHPNCDCQHVPALEADETWEFDAEEALRRGQIHGFTEAEKDAILNQGADINAIVNAKRKGVSVTKMYGNVKVRTTREGMTRRGLAHSRLVEPGDEMRKRGRYYVPVNTVRLTPYEIYRQAGNDEALLRRLLYRHGYIY